MAFGVEALFLPPIGHYAVETLRYSGFNGRSLNLGVRSRSLYESFSGRKWWT